jgi:oligopeptidase B
MSAAALAGRTVDPWAWMKDVGPEGLEPLVREEGERLVALLEELDDLTSAIQSEYRATARPTAVIRAPVARGPWVYSAYYRPGAQYPVVVRQPIAADEATLGDEDVLIDGEHEARGRPFFSLGGFTVSPDHARIAFIADLAGSERFRLEVRDIGTRTELVAPVEDVGHSLAWDGGSDAVFFTRRAQHQFRNHEVWRLGLAGGEPERIFEEPDPSYFVTLSRAKDHSNLLIRLASADTCEVLVLPCGEPTARPRRLARRTPGLRYEVESWRGNLLILADRDHHERELFLSSPDATTIEEWRPIWRPPPGVQVESFVVFRDFIGLLGRRNGAASVAVLDLSDGELTPSSRAWDVPLPESSGSVSIADNPDFDRKHLRFTFASFRRPRSTYLAHPRERRVEPGPGTEGPDFDPESLTASLHRVTTADGAEVPLSLVQSADHGARAGPVIVSVYGSYGRCHDPWFNFARLSVLRRGMSYAIAHVRGGGELGPAWHEAGRGTLKPNVVSDYLACLRYLVDQGIARPGRIVGRGRSAGAVPVAAAVNREPALFAGAILESPLLDCVAMLSDAASPLTTLEWGEWGDPTVSPEDHDRVASYSPYEGLGRQPYPPILITAGLADARIGCWQVLKYVAKLRHLNPDAQVWVRLDADAGHFGPAARSDLVALESLVLAFAHRCVTRSG